MKMFNKYNLKKIISYREFLEKASDFNEDKDSLTKKVTEKVSPIANLATNIANIPLEKEFINHNFGPNQYFDEAAKIFPYTPGVYSDTWQPDYEQILRNAIVSGQVTPSALFQAFSDGKITESTLKTFLDNITLNQYNVADAIEAGKIDSTFLLSALKNGTISLKDPQLSDASFLLAVINNNRIDKVALINAFRNDAVSVQPDFIYNLAKNSSLTPADLQNIISIKDITFLKEVIPDTNFFTNAITNGKITVNPTFINDAIMNGKISNSVMANLYQNMSPNGINVAYFVGKVPPEVLNKIITDEQIFKNLIANPGDANTIIANGIRNGSVHPEELLLAVKNGQISSEVLTNAGINLNNFNPTILTNILTNGNIDPTLLNDAIRNGKITIDPTLLSDAINNNKIDLTALANSVKNGYITVNNQSLLDAISKTNVDKQTLIDAINKGQITINNPTALMTAGGNNILHDAITTDTPKANVTNQFLIDAITKPNKNTDLTSLNGAIKDADLSKTTPNQEHELLNGLNIKHDPTVTEAIVGNIAGTAATFGIIGAASFAGPFIGPFAGVFLGKLFTGIRNIFRKIQGKLPIKSPVAYVNVGDAAIKGSLFGVILGGIKGGLWGTIFGPLGIAIGVGLGCAAGGAAGALGGASGAGVFNGLTKFWKYLNGKNK